MKLEVRLPAGCNQRVLFTHFGKFWDRPFVCNISFMLDVPFPHMFACNKAAVSLPFFSFLFRGGMIQTCEQYQFVHHVMSLYGKQLSRAAEE